MSAHTKAVISDYSFGLATSDKLILSKFFPRNYLSIQNEGPGACAVSFNGTAAATAARGSIMLASGQSMLFEREVPQSEIHAISASTSMLLVQSDDVIAIPSFILQTTPIPTFDLNFSTGQYWISPLVLPTTSFLTVSRASQGTNLLPSSASGASFATFANNVARITSGLGILIERARTNNLLNSTAPVTQTTASLGTGSYTLWVNGTGSATSSAGTAVGAGFGAATNGTPNIFSVSVAGTVVVTVGGSLNSFQLEDGASGGTSLIVTGGTTATRARDNVTIPASFGSGFSLYAHGTPSDLTTLANDQPILTLDDGTLNNLASSRRAAATGIPVATVISGGVTQYSQVLSGSAWAVGTPASTSLSSIAGTQFATFAGVAGTAGMGATQPLLMNTIRIGANSFGDSFDAYIDRIAVWPSVALSQAVLNGLPP